jgi:hypothetical protein
MGQGETPPSSVAAWLPRALILITPFQLGSISISGRSMMQRTSFQNCIRICCGFLPFHSAVWWRSMNNRNGPRHEPEPASTRRSIPPRSTSSSSRLGDTSRNSCFALCGTSRRASTADSAHIWTMHAHLPRVLYGRVRPRAMEMI